jgi:glycosyltransferase involved in cell wall biosynthesis
MLQKSRYDLLHTHEEASFFGIFLAKIFGLRHLYDMHSSLPQQLANFEYISFPPFIRIFEWLEYRVIESSAAIITICPALQAHVKKLNGIVPDVLIENVASERPMGAAPEEAVRTFERVYSLNGKKIVLYAGTFEPYQGIDLLIASAARVVAQRNDVVFLLVGGKPNQIQQYQKRIDELGLAPYFRLVGTRPPQEIPLAVRLAHVLVSPRTHGTNTPLKIYAYLQSGKPIVATNGFTHTQVLDEDAAVLVAAEPAAFAGGILSALEDESLAMRMGARARQLFETRYSYQSFLDKTDQVMRLAVR